MHSRNLCTSVQFLICGDGKSSKRNPLLLSNGQPKPHQSYAYHFLLPVPIQFQEKSPNGTRIHTLNHCKKKFAKTFEDWALLCCLSYTFRPRAGWAGKRGVPMKRRKVFMATRKTWMSGPYVLSRLRWVIKKEMVTVYHPSMTMRQRVQKISKLIQLAKNNYIKGKKSSPWFSCLRWNLTFVQEQKKWKMNKFQGLEVITRNKKQWRRETFPSFNSWFNFLVPNKFTMKKGLAWSLELGKVEFILAFWVLHGEWSFMKEEGHKWDVGMEERQLRDRRMAFGRLRPYIGNVYLMEVM